jgi:hypothetical protein
MDVTVYAFVKFSKKEHLESLREKGTIYMNTLGYFKKLEGMSGDKNEGMDNFYQGTKMKAVIIPHGEGDAAPIEGLKSMGSQKGEDMARNVFCLHAITNTEPELHPGNLKRNDHALVIINPHIFLQMFENAANEQRVGFRCGFVKYVDRKRYHGKMGCFKKFKEFENENEYRILKKEPTGKPFVFEIGSIKSISELVEKDKVASCIQKLLGR